MVLISSVSREELFSLKMNQLLDSSVSLDISASHLHPSKEVSRLNRRKGNKNQSQPNSQYRIETNLIYKMKKIGIEAKAAQGRRCDWNAGLPRSVDSTGTLEAQWPLRSHGRSPGCYTSVLISRWMLAVHERAWASVRWQPLERLTVECSPLTRLPAAEATSI